MQDSTVNDPLFLSRKFFPRSPVNKILVPLSIMGVWEKKNKKSTVNKYASHVKLSLTGVIVRALCARYKIRFVINVEILDEYCNLFVKIKLLRRHADCSSELLIENDKWQICLVWLS